MPLALNVKSAWILGATWLVTAASPLAGCASMPSTDSRGAESAGTSRDNDASISDSRPDPVGHHALRDLFLEPANVSVSIFSLFGLPIVLIAPTN